VERDGVSAADLVGTSTADRLRALLTSSPLDGGPTYAFTLADHADRLRLFFLRPYCPVLNPTEYLNNAVKGGVPRFRRPRDKGELASRVRLWLRVLQGRPSVAKRFFQAEPVRYAA
jgi:hypothetical protein